VGVRTATAEISVLPDGIVLTRIDPGVKQSLDAARENLAATIAACGGVRRRLLVDISRCQPLEPEVRHEYTGDLLVASFVALAILVESSPFGRMMGNLYLRIARAGIPMRLFVNEQAAFAWLRSQRI
jgi:hypothetical protein